MNKFAFRLLIKFWIGFIIGMLWCECANSQIIYLTDNRYEADYICTIVNNKYEADWLIKVNDWKRYSQQNHGNWYFTQNKYEATFKIHLSSGYFGGGDKARKIYFVCNQHEATLNDKY